MDRERAICSSREAEHKVWNKVKGNPATEHEVVGQAKVKAGYLVAEQAFTEHI